MVTSKTLFIAIGLVALAVAMAGIGVAGQHPSLDVSGSNEVSLSSENEVQTEGTITGTIIDETTGEEIDGAVVFVEGDKPPPERIGTEADGTYSIDVEAGVYNVTVRAPQYEIMSVSVTVEADELRTQDFELARHGPPDRTPSGGPPGSMTGETPSVGGPGAG